MTTQQRLNKICRNLMSAYARRWKVIRHDDQQRVLALQYLHHAIELRDQSMTDFLKLVKV